MKKLILILLMLFISSVNALDYEIDNTEFVRSVLVGEKMTETISIQNTGWEDLKIMQEPSNLMVIQDPLILRPGKQETFEFDIEGIEEGRFKEYAFIFISSVNPPVRTKQENITVSYTVLRKPESFIRVDIMPDKLTSKRLYVGETLNVPFTVKNMNFDKLLVKISDAAVTPKILNLEAGDEGVFTLKLVGVRLGQFSDTIPISLNIGDISDTHNYSIEYNVIEGKELGEYCVFNDDCKTNYCDKNVCHVLSQSFQGEVEGIPNLWWFIGGIAVFLLMAVFVSWLGNK